MPVLKSGNLFLALLLLAAGCSTPPRRTPAPPPDWEGANTIHIVPQPQPTPQPPRQPEPQPAITNLVTPSWIPLAQWSRSNGFDAPQRLTGGTQASYAVTTPRGVLAVKSGSRTARWAGMTVQLGYAPQETNGRLFIHAIDARKNLQPLLAAAPLPARNSRIIVIDPGHGGINAGTKSVLGNHYEKEYTLDWAKRLAPLLATNGWTVFLTRTNDTDIALSNRVAFAEAYHADLFLSLHFNSAAPNTEPNGLETYCLTPAGMPSSLTRDFEDNLALVFPNNSFDDQNLQYAACIHRALLGVNGDADRGIAHARFMGVLRGQRRAAVLLEGGYLSNPREARRIADPAHRAKLAEAVANALR